jgi:ADP-ribose pyrophosphatase
LNTSILSHQIVYQGRLFSVESLLLLLENQKEHRYERVNHKDSVTILPVDDQKRILFVTQYRVGANQQLLELPAGVMEANEDPRTCALREVREEVGMAADLLTRLGSYYLAPGYCTEINHAFLAQELHPAPLSSDEDEFLKIDAIPVDQAYRMAEKGEIQDGKSLAALLLAKPILYK